MLQNLTAAGIACSFALLYTNTALALEAEEKLGLIGLGAGVAFAGDHAAAAAKALETFDRIEKAHNASIANFLLQADAAIKGGNDGLGAAILHHIDNQEAGFKALTKNMVWLPKIRNYVATGFDVTGKVLSVADWGVALFEVEKELIQTGTVSGGSALKLVESIAAFEPTGITGATIYARDEIVKVIDLARDIDSEYGKALNTISEQYYRQYNTLSTLAFDGKDPGGWLDLYAKQRLNLVEQLEGLLKQIKSSIPFIGKTDLINQIKTMQAKLLDPNIQNKQREFYDKQYERIEGYRVVKLGVEEAVADRGRDISNALAKFEADLAQISYSYDAPISSVIEIGVAPPEKPVLSPIISDQKDIVVGSINNDLNSDAIKNALIGELPSTSSTYWHGNFVLNYVNGSGIFTTFGYGDGGFSTPSKPEANAAATLTYYHLGERDYQVDIRSVDYPGDYSYTAWGSWTEGDQRLAAFEADYAYASNNISKLTPWVAVQRMSPEDVNRLSGTATYSGVLSGVMIGDTGASGFQSGTGMFGMTANFNNDTVTGAVIVMRSPSSPAWATANFSTSLNDDLDGGLEFNSQLTGTGISNAENWHSQIRGELGGPQANEAGGIWAITKTDGSQATGTFHAKKETNQVAP